MVYEMDRRVHLRKTGAARGIEAVGCLHEAPTSSDNIVETDLQQKLNPNKKHSAASQCPLNDEGFKPDIHLKHRCVVRIESIVSSNLAGASCRGRP